MNADAGPGGGNGQGDAAKTGPPRLAHLDRLMEELHAQTPKALRDFDEDAIHRARVATRRLSAALNLVEPVVGNKRRKALARVLRKLRRRLGPLRDADVMLGHLQELGGGGAKHAAALEWLGGRIDERRAALREASAKKAAASEVLADLGAWHPVREQVASSADAIDSLLVQSLHLQLDAFAEQAGRIAGQDDDPAHHPHRHDPHELRIAGKALRYTLEMAAAQGHPLPGSVLKKFKRMQELLGAWHDFVVLTDEAMRTSLDAVLSHRDPAAQDAVLELARLTLRRSAQQLAQFSKLWTAKGGPLAETIRSTFPLTPAPAAPPAPAPPAPAAADVIGSQTGLDQPGSAGPEVPAVSPPGDPSPAS